MELANTMCNCIPWDFIHATKAQECDVFGRTCFYNAMENFTVSSGNYCDHCIEECDHITYNAIIKKEQPIYKHELFKKDYNTGKCAGEKVFCDFFRPDSSTNGTLIDRGVENAFNTFTNNFIDVRSDMAADDMVVIHLRILKPEVDVTDVKHSLIDKLANFGGNFGIFAEITGCSFLVLLNILILLFKLPFSSNTQ